MNKAKFISFASVISEMKQSDMFMSVKMRILETPKANLNGVRVTEAFIDEIIADEDRYVGLPLYADVKSLLSGKYNHLGHMYNSKTGEFYSTQIGSFYQFEKEKFDGGAYLVGYARLPKRNVKISKAIAELFAESALKFSFEIACADYTEEDGILVIDASENNYLEGTAIVTFPACEDAVALEFVAQREAGNTERGEMEMAEVEKLENEIVAEQEVVAEETEATETPVEQAEVQQTETAEEAVKETAEVQTEEIAETEETKEETETAEVYIREEKTEKTETFAYDTETGMEVHQEVEIKTSIGQPAEGTLVEVEEGFAVAEADGDTPGGDVSNGDTSGGNTPVADTPGKDTPGADTTDSGDAEDDAPGAAAEDIPQVETPKKKTAEEMIAELTETINALAEEVKSLKEQRVTASKIEEETINPFVDCIVAKGSYYDLLQPAEKLNGHDLLSK